MSTGFLSHTDCEKHEMLPHHPESPARLRVIREALHNRNYGDDLLMLEAREISAALFDGIHPKHYTERLAELEPGDGILRLEADTSINRHSLRAARLAAGAAVQAVDLVMAGEVNNAFCAVRPPGHHAESALPMGFCIFNNVALAAERALAAGAQRVAVFDFDVHHGNGTAEIFLQRPEVLVCSSFQYPFYPGRFDDVDAENIILTPLPEGTASADFRLAIERDWLPAIAGHKPDLVLVSAGFDAHREDPLAGLLLEDEDYRWLTELLRDAADRHAGGRLVSVLEGGYQLEALARSTLQHLDALVA